MTAKQWSVRTRRLKYVVCRQAATDLSEPTLTTIAVDCGAWSLQRIACEQVALTTGFIVRSRPRRRGAQRESPALPSPPSAPAAAATCRAWCWKPHQKRTGFTVKSCILVTASTSTCPGARVRRIVLVFKPRWSFTNLITVLHCFNFNQYCIKKLSSDKVLLISDRRKHNFQQAVIKFIGNLDKEYDCYRIYMGVKLDAPSRQLYFSSNSAIKFSMFSQCTFACLFSAVHICITFQLVIQMVCTRTNDTLK